MATQTTNYGFEKPAATDKLSVLVNYNGNLDLIDSTIKTVSDAATTASSTALPLKGKALGRGTSPLRAGRLPALQRTAGGR